MDSGLCYRWLGVAGVELACGAHTLLIDPFFTRPPFYRLFFGRVAADRALVARHVRRADAILVTHAHYDHLLDVPAAAELTGGRVYGSPNTCALAQLHGLPTGQVQVIRPGTVLEIGPFRVTVHAAEHMATPLDRQINGLLPPDLRLPLRLTDHRMDTCFSFLIEAGGWRLLHGETLVPADVWFSAPVRGFAMRPLLDAVRPRLVVPVHWDDMFRPLSRPIRPTLSLPRRAFPLRPLRRLDLADYARRIEQISPGMPVRLPVIFRPVWLGERDLFSSPPDGQTAR